MQTIRTRAQSGPDGIVNLSVPTGQPNRDVEVVLVVRTARARRPKARSAREEWREFLSRTYGSCAGLGLKRPPQGAYEKREEID